MRSAFFFLFSILLILPLYTHSQNQIGGDIDGEAATNNSGTSVSFSADGKRIAIGAPNNSNGSGHVRVYEEIDNMWIKVGNDIDGFPEENAGDAVALSADGKRVIVGAPAYNCSGCNGFSRIYEEIGGDWSQVGGILIGEDDDDSFGKAVSISADGSRIVVGAPTSDNNGSNGAGQVRAYEDNGGNWIQLGNPMVGLDDLDYAGWSVSLSGNGTRIAVGAPELLDSDDGSGWVRIFEYNGSSWSPLGGIIEGEINGDNSGWSVSLSGDGKRLVIGSPYSILNSQLGHVRVYEENNGFWGQIGDIIYGNGNSSNFGLSVSISMDGSRIAIGEPDIAFNGPGQVQVFEEISGNWVQIGNTLEGENSGDEFGSAVAISPDGNRIAAGAPGNSGNGPGAGHVRVFDINCQIPDVGVSQYGETLTALETDVDYQWVDCDNDFEPISGATEQSYVPEISGSYAVVLMNGTCVDTSACLEVTIVNVHDINSLHDVSTFPNPANHSFILSLDKIYSEATISIEDSSGQMMDRYIWQQKEQGEIDISAYAPGIYWVRIQTPEGSSSSKILKQ